MGNKSKTHTSWRGKLEKQNQEAVIHKCLLPRHLDVEAIIRKAPKGKLITDKQIRDKLTEDYKVDFTCAKVTNRPMMSVLRGSMDFSVLI